MTPIERLGHIPWLCRSPYLSLAVPDGRRYELPSGMTSTSAEISPDLSRHLLTALDGRWHQVRDRCREQLSGEVFRPHYTPNTVIARTKAMEQLKIIAAAGAADDG